MLSCVVRTLVPEQGRRSPKGLKTTYVPSIEKSQEGQTLAREAEKIFIHEREKTESIFSLYTTLFSLLFSL
jgi:hypothetical protein